jgi:uncharacterized membrane protein YraQ (UPF0718 family)/copper chaperone CopZ
MTDFLLSFVASAWWVLAEMAPYLLLGFFFAGLLSVVISAEWVERHLGGAGLGQVFKASLFGVPLPLCSCGVLPVAASLRRQGASRGATTAFLLSTPQTGVDSIAVTYALLGPFLAVLRPVAALITGFVGGGLVHGLAERNGPGGEAVVDGAACAADDCCDDEQPSSFLEGMHYGFVTLPRDIGRALLAGIAISGVIGALVEPAALEGMLGGGLLPMLAAMAVGIPLYVCATASTPIALSLIFAGLSPGAALVFLISGPATNSAALTTLWRVLGRRTTVIYLVTVAVCALATGLAVDAIIATGLVPGSAVITPVDAATVAAHHEHGEAVGFGWWLRQASAVGLLGLVAAALWWPRRETAVEPAAVDGRVIEMRVRGMNCNGCVQSLTRALRDCTGVTGVDVRLDDGTARVSGNGLVGDQLLQAVRSLGFELENPEVLAES